MQLSIPFQGIGTSGRIHQVGPLSMLRLNCLFCVHCVCACACVRAPFRLFCLSFVCMCHEFLIIRGDNVIIQEQKTKENKQGLIVDLRCPSLSSPFACEQGKDDKQGKKHHKKDGDNDGDDGVCLCWCCALFPVWLCMYSVFLVFCCRVAFDLCRGR